MFAYSSTTTTRVVVIVLVEYELVRESGGRARENSIIIRW